VRQAERGEPGERHDIGAQPDDEVEQLDHCLRDRRAAMARLGREPGSGQPETRDGYKAASCEPPALMEMPPGGPRRGAEKHAAARDARRRVQGGTPAAFAPPVDRAQRVGAGEQDRAEAGRGRQQGDRLRERAEPEDGHQAGRAEALPIQQPERSCSQAGAADERPGRAEPAQPSRPAEAERHGRADHQHALAGVPEHNPALPLPGWHFSPIRVLECQVVLMRRSCLTGIFLIDLSGRSSSTTGFGLASFRTARC